MALAGEVVGIIAMDDQRPNRALIFSIAFNGYQWIYARNIKTHRVYAKKIGVDYVMVSRPAFTELSMECAWLKLPLAASALAHGYEWVFFIDADAEIRGDCPDFRTLARPDRSLYMANGYSGRLNSGVIIAKNSPEVRALLLTIVGGFNETLPEEDAVGWGENGHLIHFAKHAPFLEIIPQTWNNNSAPGLVDHVRHYSAGPMRRLYRVGPFAKAARCASNAVLRFADARQPYRYAAEMFPQRLTRLYGSCVRRNPEFFSLLTMEEIFHVRDQAGEPPASAVALARASARL